MITKPLLVIACVFLFACAANPDYPATLQMKCLPFRSSSTVPILEDSFDKLSKETFNRGSIKFITIKDLKERDKIKSLVEILDKIIKQKPVDLDDYDVKASITFEGKKEKYYFNWDRKHLIYKSSIYLMSKDDFHDLDQIVNFCQ